MGRLINRSDGIGCDLWANIPEVTPDIDGSAAPSSA